MFTDPDKQLQLLKLIWNRSSQIEFPNSAISANPDVAFMIPLVAGDNEVGMLCLAPKVSRQDFSSVDVFLLQGLVSVSAVALRNAILSRDVSQRDTFVSIASHELWTPLTSIIGYAELMLKRNHPEETQKIWLNNILINGQRITDMVDDLLNVSRIQSGKVSRKPGK